MTVWMAAVGVGLLLLGLVMAALGWRAEDPGIGATSITVGAMIACSGVITLGLWTVARELRQIARRLGAFVEAAPRAEIAPVPVSAPAVVGERGAASIFEEPAPDMPPPAAEPAEAQPPPRRRNLLFSSTLRKGRERTEAGADDELPLTPDLLSPELRPSSPPAPASAPEPPAPAGPINFDDAWPKSERTRPGAAEAFRRAARPPSIAEANPIPAPDRHPLPPQEQPPVTVLKSGVVDGMAYSLYSDGSIEAQMPEGMMRFASIDELRSHLEQRS